MVAMNVSYFMKEDVSIGLVFSGGGSRGSYQIGVWQALIDMGLAHHVKAVYGTSVGAINAAAFVQSDIQLALEIWQELTFSKVFADLPKEDSALTKRKLYLNWIKGALKNRGLDVSPLKELLRSVLREEKIRASNIDYGMVVYDITNRKARYLKKEEITKGQLVEYIIASATFPIFQPHRIEDNLYIDGGIYDNRPIGFLRGKDKIDIVIVIDVTMARHVWPTKRFRKDIDIYYVRPTRLLGSPLAFRSRRIVSNLELGYQNTMDQLAHLKA